MGPVSNGQWKPVCEAAEIARDLRGKAQRLRVAANTPDLSSEAALELRRASDECEARAKRIESQTVCVE